MSASGFEQHSKFRLEAGMRLGAPTIRVRDLDAMLSFYEGQVGFVVKGETNDASGLREVELGFKNSPEPILRLKNDPAARRVPSDFAGLYHYAVLVPQRRDLASTFLSIGNSGVIYEGFADHTFSEALYLHDVELNGIEVYADRPRSDWPDWGKMLQRGYGAFAAMNSPLNLDSLLRELTPAERAAPVAFPKGARIGHMHLRVTDLERSVRFYKERLGLDVNAYMPEIGAAFLSVGGYHHHLGLNTWHSEGGTPHTEGEAGLEEFRIVLPSRSSLDALSSRFPGSEVSGGVLRLKDPDGICIRVQA